MIEEVKGFFSDVKDGIGDKGFLILIGAAVLFGLYNLVKSSNDEGVYTANAYASYPDVDTNSEVVIDSINNTIEGAKDEILGSIDSSYSEIIVDMNEQFQATNDYIKEGIEKTDEMSSKLDNVNTAQQVTVSYGTVSDSGSTAGVSSSGGKPTASTQKSSTTTKVKENTAATYTYKTKAGLNTNTSIVDALKATGVDSGMENRAEIAAANGIKNYTGTAAQNVKMLNMLKAGTLKKV